MTILIVDDEIDATLVLASLIRRHGLGETLTCHSGEAALAAVDADQEQTISCILSDLRMPGISGLELLRQLRERGHRQPFVLLTAFADIEDAKTAIRLGATDYLVKPYDPDRLVELVRRHLPSDDPGRAYDMVGASAAMRRLYEGIDGAAEADCTVLITGESGTGKELVAQALHRHSQRRDRPLVAVNTAAIAQSLGESALFGHETGAFTGADRRHQGFFEQADEGTLFLDEIGDMPLELQGKLLRALQERRFQRLGGRGDIMVDVRFLAATNQPLQRLIDEGRFRADLYYRINVLTLTVPPLRDRGADVLLLAHHFLHDHAFDPARLEQAAGERLLAHSWPGNVRELQAVCQRLALRCKERCITDTDVDLALDIPSPHREGDGAADRAPPPTDYHDIANHERQLICNALAQAHGNKSQAAKILGITRRRLYSRLAILGLDA